MNQTQLEFIKKHANHAHADKHLPQAHSVLTQRVLEGRLRIQNLLLHRVKKALLLMCRGSMIYPTRPCRGSRHFFAGTFLSSIPFQAMQCSSVFCIIGLCVEACVPLDDAIAYRIQIHVKTRNFRQSRIDILSLQKQVERCTDKPSRERFR